MTARAYLLEHVVCGTHLRDRLGMQRFIGSLLLAAWPCPSKLDWRSETGMDLSDRMNNCLTNVVYFEEILGKKEIWLYPFVMYNITLCHHAYILGFLRNISSCSVIHFL